MCEPVSIVTGIISAVTAITSTAISIDQENKAIEAQNQANIHNANIAIQEANDLSKQEGIAEQNEQKAAAEQTMQLKRDNMQKSATARASSQAEGNASHLVANEYARMFGNDTSVIQQNLNMSKQQHNMARDMYIKTAQNQIAGMQDIKPSNRALGYTALGINLASAGLKGYNKYDSSKDVKITRENNNYGK